MNNRSLDVTNNPNEVLKEIANTHGIDMINAFVKEHNKKQRKKQVRVNGYADIACNVYVLMRDHGYSKTRALDKIALDKNINFNTVRNHCAKFDKEAKEFDYYSFGALIEDTQRIASGNYSIYEHLVSDLASLNDIETKIALVYHFKYHEDKKKKKVQTVDYSRFNETDHTMYNNAPF